MSCIQQFLDQSNSFGFVNPGCTITTAKSGNCLDAHNIPIRLQNKPVWPVNSVKRGACHSSCNPADTVITQVFKPTVDCWRWSGGKTRQIQKIILARVGDTLLKDMILSRCTVFESCRRCSSSKEIKKEAFALEGHDYSLLAQKHLIKYCFCHKYLLQSTILVVPDKA